MKKIFFSALAGLLCICYSCNNAGTPAAGDGADKEMQKKNLEASNTVMKAFETGDASKIDSVIADDFVDHTDRGDKVGRDSLKAMVKFVNENFKDMKAERVRDVTDGDYVYSWVNWSGTSGGGMGMPSGPYKFGSIEVSRFKDGKAVEHWGFMNVADMAKMMPPPPPAADMKKMDSSAMKK